MAVRKQDLRTLTQHCGARDGDDDQPRPLDRQRTMQCEHRQRGGGDHHEKRDRGHEIGRELRVIAQAGGEFGVGVPHPLLVGPYGEHPEGDGDVERKSQLGRRLADEVGHMGRFAGDLHRRQKLTSEILQVVSQKRMANEALR